MKTKGYQSLTLAIVAVGIMATAAFATYDKILKTVRGGTNVSSAGASGNVLSSDGTNWASSGTVTAALSVPVTIKNGDSTLTRGLAVIQTDNTTQTLPEASGFIGQTITIKTMNHTNIVVAAGAGDTVDEAASFAMPDAFQSASFTAISSSEWVVY